MQSPLPIDRGKLRMERLRQLELEQLQWEQEALIMPEDLNRALFLSFESVKTEFSDLDGLSWSRYPVVSNAWPAEEPTPKLTSAEIDEFSTAPDPCNGLTPAHSPTFSHDHTRTPTTLPYAPSSHADVTLFAQQDSSRVSRPAQSSWSPLRPANQFFPAQYGTSHRDPLTRRSGSPFTHSHARPPETVAFTCHHLQHSTHGHR